MADYKILLGTQLDTSDIVTQINEAERKIDPIKIKVDAETKELTKTIQDALKGLSSGTKNAFTLDTSKFEDSIADIKSAVVDLKKVLGSLDDSANMKSLLASVNQIANAIGKVTDESETLVKSLSILSKKDFGFNFNLKTGNANPLKAATDYGREARRNAIPALQEQASALQDLLGGYQQADKALERYLTKIHKASGISVKNNLIDDMSNTGSMAKQMEAIEKYIGYLKKIAVEKGIDLSGFDVQFSKSAENIIDDTVKIQTGAKQTEEALEAVGKEMKQVFGGGISAEQLSAQLDPIVADLKQIREAVVNLSKGVSLEGLTSSFDRLSNSIENLLANAEKVKGVFNSGFDSSKVGNTSTTNASPIESAQQTGRKIGEAVKQSAKQALTLDDVIDEQVQNLMNQYGIVGKKGSQAFEQIKQALVEYRMELASLDSVDNDFGDFIEIFDEDDVADIRKVTDALAANMKVADQTSEVYEDLVQYVKQMNNTGHKVYLPDTIKQEYGDDFSRMRSQLGKAFTTSQSGVDFESWVTELNSELGNVIDLSQGAEAAFGDLVNKVQMGRDRSYLSGDDLIKSGMLDMDDMEFDVINALGAIEEGEKRIAQTAAQSANAVVQAEERKQQAIKETAKETSQLLEYFRKYNAIDKASSPEDSVYHNMDVDSVSLKNAEYHRNQIIKQLTSGNGIGKITSLGSIDDGEISQRNLEYFSAMNAELEKLGYTLGEIKANSDNSVLSADIIPIDENAVKDAEEMRNILFGVESQQEKVAQSASDVANTIVQAEEKKQQAHRETSGVIDNLKTTLETMRVDRSSIDAIVKDVEELGFTAKNTSVEMKNGKFDITVNGIDEIGRAITEIRRFDSATDEISLVGRKISQPLAESDKFIKQQKKSVVDLTNQINQLNRSAIDQNASRPIKNTSHLDALSSKYDEITHAIERMENASSDTFVDEQNNVRKLISEYKSLVSEYKNAENVSTKMKGTDFGSGLDIAKNDLKKFKAEAKDFPQITATVKELDKAIKGVGDAASLNKFNDQLRVARSELAKVKSETTALNRSKKVGINVSGLESKIADIQRISPEIDKFEAEIDGAKVSVQSLLNNLKQVKTQSDFSTVNARFKAFKDAAQAAGIAVAETAQKAKSINDIKIKLSDTGFNGFEQEVLRAHAEAEKLELSTDELQNALRRLDTAFNEVYSADQAGDTQRLVAANEKYEASLRAVYSQLKLNQQMEKDAYNNEMLSQKKASLSSEMEIWLKENTRAAKDFGDEIRRLQASLDSLDDRGVKLVGQQFKTITKQAQAMGKTGLTVFDRLKSKAKEYMTYLSAAEMFMWVEQAFREMFNTVKEIDTAMTGLYRVTDLTAAEYNSLFDNMISSAKEYGATLNDIINATTDWVRAGFDANTALGMAEITTMYQHISDLDYDTAAENLLTAYNGFKDELNGLFGGDEVASVNYIADILNELDKQNCP